jgi:phosphopantetheine--protein transferase-like protein
MLKRIFSEQEITYCLKNPYKSAERFAVRFAAREAFFKALQPMLCKPLPFLLLCRHVTITKSQCGVPSLSPEWKTLKEYVIEIQPEKIRCHLTLSHSHCCANALVIIEQINKYPEVHNFL